MIKASDALILKHLDKLCNGIGIRLAGARGEKLAADYLAETLEKTGAKVHIETFPVNARCVRKETLEVKIGGRWKKFGGSLFSNTPGTGGKPIEAPLVFFEAAAEYQRPDLNYLRGKAVVHLGCHIESRDHYRRLIGARPAFLLMVDTRYPGTQPLADGMFPHYFKAFGGVPTLDVAYLDAWGWNVNRAEAARICVSGGMRPAESQNVVAELPGADPSAMFYVGGHHDTQAGSVGADDNAIGSIAVVELARILAAEPRKHPIRLISFGAEEQLSEGSAAYVRRHRKELAANGAGMFNFDAFGSHMGWYYLICNGPPQFNRVIKNFLEKRDLFARVVSDLNPYGDHFPFVAAGVPGCVLERLNCAAGRFFHHRADDDLSRVSPDGVARVLDAFAGLLAYLSNGDKLPFPTTIPESQAGEAARVWEDIFGGWRGGSR